MLWIQPQWKAPAHVQAISTTREHGVSKTPFAALNLGHHVGDEPADVAANRVVLQQRAKMPSTPLWLNQVHGTNVITLPYSGAPYPNADAVFTRTPNQVCAIMTADCLPILLCNHNGTEVAAIHAGWRGLLHGVIEATLGCFSDKTQLHAWLGPAISQRAFEVRDDVRDAFIAEDALAAAAFNAQGSAWLADLYLLARQRLQRHGIREITGGEYCTFSEPERFFSYRREAITGRQASCIWINT